MAALPATRPRAVAVSPVSAQNLEKPYPCLKPKLSVEILHRIDGRVVDDHFVVQMGTGRPARHSDRADGLAALNFLANNHENLA